MQVNKFVTMAVGLVVGVLLIAGVVAPVIANVSSDNGGEGESNPTYTNTGDMYYQIPDGQEHIIAIDYTGNSMQFKFDGTLLFEKPMGEDDRWMIPLHQTLYEGTTFTHYIIWGVSNVNMGLLPNDHVITLAYAEGNTELHTADYYDDITIGNFLTIKTNYENVSNSIAYLYGGDEEYPNVFENVQWYLANSGEYVYSATPTVMGDTILTFAYYECSISETVQQYVWMCGQSTLTQITDDHDFGYDGYKYDVSADTDDSISDLTVNVNSTSLTDATRINSMVMVATWENYDDSSITYSANYTIAGFVVPVTVTKTDAPPEYGFWKMAGEDEWDLYTGYMGNNTIGLYFDDPSISDPFFTIEIVNGESNDVLPIMIGDDFFVYIYYQYDMYDWRPDFWIIGDNGDGLSARSDEIHVNGTAISFTSNIEYDSPIYTLDGLIAHISDEGDYTAYPNGDATSVTYSAVNGWFSAYDESTEESYDAHIYATMDGSGLMWSDGFAYVYHGDVYTTNNWTSASATATYTKSDGKYTGMSINGTYDSNLDLSEDVPFGAHQEGSESGFDECIAFAIGPIDNGGGSGGSDLSPTLKTVLSVIPLVLTVGLVLGAVTYLRMRN